ncbi:MAG: choline-sulfatase [bacterium]
MNILLLMADQLTTRVLSAYGSAGAALTPNMDGLAARGTVFENAYCNSPLCVPSRAALCTGRLPNRIRSYDNGSELPAAVPTFMHHLRAAGWSTALSGKMHFVGPDQLHGFEERLITDIYPAAMDWTPDWSRGVYGNPGASGARLGRSGPCPSPTVEMQYDDTAQSRALAWLQARCATHQANPFLLCVSFTHPHDPFIITEPYWNRHGADDIPPSQALPDPQPHPFNRWINTHHELDRFPPNAETIHRSRRAYYGMVSYVDDKIGEWMKELERLGLQDDTLVLFTSDHGEMLGEHGMWFKRTFFDAASKVPLIVAGPGVRAGQRIGETVSLVDLFPTLLDCAGVPSNGEDLDGSSLVPLLEGKRSGACDTAFCEYCGEGPMAPMRFIRKGDHKYVQVHGQPPLLFDLSRDPLEQHNLADRPEWADVARALACELLAGGDPQQTRADVQRSQQERLLVGRALRAGKVQAWDWPDDITRL